MNYCISCFREATYYGEIFPGYDFIRWRPNAKLKYKWSIVKEHDEIFRFPSKPMEDPIPEGLTEEMINKLYENVEFAERDYTYTSMVKTMKIDYQFRLCPQTRKEIGNAAKKGGWIPKKHGWLEYWVMDKAAKMIKNYGKISNNTKS